MVSPEGAFGPLPYPPLPSLLFSSFPVVVLLGCVYVVTGGSGGGGGGGSWISRCIDALSTLAQGTLEWLVRLPKRGDRRRGSGVFSSVKSRLPAVYFFAAPLLFCLLRVLPRLLGGRLPFSNAGASFPFCLSAQDLFSPAAASWSTATGPEVYRQLSLFLRLVIHAWCGGRGAATGGSAFWMAGVPFCAGTGALLLLRAEKDRTQTARRGGPLAGERFSSPLILAALPPAAGFFLASILKLLGFGEVCFAGASALVFALGVVVFALDPVRFLRGLSLLEKPGFSSFSWLAGWLCLCSA